MARRHESSWRDLLRLRGAITERLDAVDRLREGAGPGSRTAIGLFEGPGRPERQGDRHGAASVRSEPSETAGVPTSCSASKSRAPDSPTAALESPKSVDYSDKRHYQ